jgi:imidazolonepropionase-like amidohydrolase
MLVTSLALPTVIRWRIAFVTLFLISVTILPSTSMGQSAIDELIVIRAERLLDVRSGKITRPGVVVVEGDRIRAVGNGELPGDAQVIDLGDMTLLPGLTDVHTHLNYDLKEGWATRPATESPELNALRGVPYARATLRAGFTTVRDLGASFGFADVALSRAIEAGWVEGPRMITSGHAISITGGHCEVTGFAPNVLEGGPKEGVADGIDEVLKAVRYQIKHGAGVIKVCATAGVLSFEGPAGAPQYSPEELRAIVKEAERHGLKVAAHAHGTEGIKNAIRAGIHSIDHGSMLDDEAIAMMIERGTYLVPTLFQWYLPYDLPPELDEKNEYVKSFVDSSMRSAFAAGVKIAFGTDAGVFEHGLNAMEFAAYVERGMSPIDAIRTATINAADLLGVDDRGELAPGLLADIIAVPGNPLENVALLEDVRFVMKGGKVYWRPTAP